MLSQDYLEFVHVFPCILVLLKPVEKERYVHLYPPQQKGNFEGVGEDSVKSRTILPFLLFLSDSPIKQVKIGT